MSDNVKVKASKFKVLILNDLKILVIMNNLLLIRYFISLWYDCIRYRHFVSKCCWCIFIVEIIKTAETPKWLSLLLQPSCCLYRSESTCVTARAPLLLRIKNSDLSHSSSATKLSYPLLFTSQGSLQSDNVITLVVRLVFRQILSRLPQRFYDAKKIASQTNCHGWNDFQFIK